MKSFHALVMLTLGALIAIAAPAAASTFTVYRSGSGAELVPNLPINGAKQTIFAQSLNDTKSGGLIPGDIVVVTAKAQVTNGNSQHEVMVDWQLWLCSTSQVTIDPTTNNPVGCTALSGNSATNCTPSQHHCTMNDGAIYPVPVAYSSPYVLWLSRSAWSYSPATGATVQVNIGNGDFQALKIRP